MRTVSKDYNTKYYDVLMKFSQDFLYTDIEENSNPAWVSDYVPGSWINQQSNFVTILTSVHYVEFKKLNKKPLLLIHC